LFGPESLSGCQNVAAQSASIADRFTKFLPLSAPVVGVITYWLGSRKRERDRRFEFYTNSVIAPSIAELDAFFEAYREKFVEQARNHGKAPTQVSIPRTITKLHQEFSQDLYRMRNALVGRIEVYDTPAVIRIDTAINDFDTKITTWLFSRNPKNHEAPNEETVTDVIQVTKRTILQSIYKCKLEILK
jgi:hypothetical protein